MYLPRNGLDEYVCETKERDKYCEWIVQTGTMRLGKGEIKNGKIFL